MEQAKLMMATQIAQAVFGLLLSGLLLAFLREFRHQFLRHWALSALAMAGYFGTAAAAMALYLADAGQGSDRLVFSTLSLVMGYLHAAWLILGAREAVAGIVLPARNQLLLIALAVAAGVLSIVLVPLSPDMAAVRLLLRVTLLHTIIGLAFLVTAYMLWRALKGFGQLSSRLTPLAFVSYGAYLLLVGFSSAWMTLTGQRLPMIEYVGLPGILLQVLVGYGIIIWLLELERRNTMTARDRAQSAQNRLAHFSMHDIATGLPNARQLQNQLSAEVRAASSKRNRVGVLLISINRFKLLSQALGWQETDRLIRRLANRLREIAPVDSVLGRLGDRDFLLIMPNIGERKRAVERARGLLDRGSRPVKQKNQELFVHLSGGLCFAPDDDIDAIALIKAAQQAQMRAAARGDLLEVHRGQTERAEPHNLLTLEREMRLGVREGQFCLYYQPLIGIRQRRIVGFESLLRWQHPERGLLTPGSFLQEATRLGILDELEEQIFQQALAQLAEWQNELSLPPISVSINLSAQRFQQPDLPVKLADLCERYKINPVDLHLEITESAAMQDFEAGLAIIGSLRELGCKVCLDDFGTGYSSLAHLRRLQIDYVKLDRSFIANIERDQHERDMTRAIVDLIHSLGMTVLAEGVENRQQLGYLLQCRVDVVQGFLMGRPQPTSELRGALERPQLILD
ncbi:MAG: EAL domain-containing protein [Gammaproteobacteria bacterium]|nr:EAL domain-containing protein [Gammaproteobacteria bacterium]